jgi:hypothetical protein
MQYLFFDTAVNGYYTLLILKKEFPGFLSLINSVENISDDNAPFIFEVDTKKLVDVLLMPDVSLKEIILLDSTQSLAFIQNYFSRFVVQTIKGKQFYFRFWAANVFRKYITTSNTMQLKEFFGPVQQFSCSDENPSFELLFSFDGNKLITQRVAAGEIFSSAKNTTDETDIPGVTNIKEENTIPQKKTPRKFFFD